jgi:hypothetical protein
LLRGLQDTIQRFTAMGRSRFDFAQNRLEDFCDVACFNASRNQILRGAQDEILNQEQINLVPVGWKFLRFAKMALQKKAEAVFTRHGWRDEEMTKVNSLYFLIHLIQPQKVAVPSPFVGPRTNLCHRRIWSADKLELAR